MGCYEINTKFKGARTYIQGPDILNQVMGVINGRHDGDLANIKFLIHQMVNGNLTLELTSEDNLNPDPDEVAVIRLQANGKPLLGRIKRGRGQPLERVPYDELLVTEQCVIDREKRSITLERDSSGFTPIEILVSMNKALHLAVLEKAKDASWVFCRWEGPEWPLPASLAGVCVSIEQTLGTRLTRSTVKLGGKGIGSIYFSAKAAS